MSISAGPAAETTRSTVDVSPVERLDELGEAVWTRLAAGHGLFASYRHLRRLETKPGLTTRYLVASSHGRPVGALPTYELTKAANPNAYHDPVRQLGAACGLTTAREHWFPFLLGAGRGALGGCLPIAADASRPEVVVASLLEAFLALAEGRPCGLEYLEPAAMRWLAPLLPAGAAVVYALPDFQIATSSMTDDGYVESLGKQRRSLVSRERRRFLRAGYTLRHVALVEALDAAPGLIANVQEAHGTRPDPDGVEQMLRAAVDELGDAARALVAFRDGDPQPVAVVTYNVGDGELHAWVWGCDRNRMGGHAEYFNMGIHELLIHARELGLRVLRLGAAATRAKAVRGARPLPRFHVLFPADLGSPDRARLRAHNDALLDELDAEAADVVGPVDRAAWVAAAAGQV